MCDVDASSKRQSFSVASVSEQTRSYRFDSKVRLRLVEQCAVEYQLAKHKIVSAAKQRKAS